MARSRKGKTWKREAGWGAALAWLLISARFWTLDGPDLVNAYGASYGAVTLTVAGFIAGLLGLDWQHRQHAPAQAEADFYRRHGRWSADETIPPDTGDYGA